LPGPGAPFAPFDPCLAGGVPPGGPMGPGFPGF